MGTSLNLLTIILPPFLLVYREIKAVEEEAHKKKKTTRKTMLDHLMLFKVEGGGRLSISRLSRSLCRFKSFKQTASRNPKNPMEEKSISPYVYTVGSIVMSLATTIGITTNARLYEDAIMPLYKKKQGVEK